MKVAEVTQAYAVPGVDHLIDVINPETGLTWINGETLENVRERYPLAELVDIEQWLAAKGAAQDTPITWSPVSDERAAEMLNVLPPAAYGTGGAFLVGEPVDHHAVSGAPRFEAYTCATGKWEVSSRPLTRAEFHKICGKTGGAA